ncbi:uncharacterized protein RSE6_14258 [Rhynchosporium secalis]|uniref:Uncharacterized protein n=1 Tax=Rhynchosporium secalis TaxID=38038 RepID=A0A1E1MUW7_RHYSE|nr:uncharacterized protein RSE6_14258 [Rhynchosporium secalis]
MQDDSDIVNSHGVYLVTRPRTPVFHADMETEEIPRRCERIANRAHAARDQGEMGRRETIPSSISEYNEEEKATGIRLGKRSRGITSDENVEEDISISTLHKRQRRSTYEENKEENDTILISEDKEVEKD